ncbi:hypothetical protein BS47DRAFT_1290620 [Hydnum rufescens UP504]|uniref:Signal recognition particle subunit SRP72 n=1 Tax=Hydnum rufescens UP504 TaxID=1448309 RepID=A0A9P6B587_9AGAM|nr:hypothetical protein BS47DRAFT_1290620 [Hydnum rufescens UP504]
MSSPPYCRRIGIHNVFQQLKCRKTFGGSARAAIADRDNASQKHTHANDSNQASVCIFPQEGQGPEAPRPVEEQLRRHFTSLVAQIDGGFSKNAIKTCDKILRILPNDPDTVRTKLFLLLQTDQYNPALDLLETSNKAIEASGNSPGYQFDKAYVLYRLHREDEAREILLAMGDDPLNRGVQHLDAQVKFRKGEYEAARNVYNQLLDTCSPDTDEYSDLLTNLGAAQTHLDFLEKDYLQAVHSLPTNASALEAAPPPTLPSSHNILQPNAQKQNVAVVALAPKTPRKSRVPKHVVLGTTPMPDPERWLKKRERTRVEGRGRKGKTREGMGVGATQGSAVSDIKITSNTPSNASGHAKKGKKGR